MISSSRYWIVALCLLSDPITSRVTLAQTPPLLVGTIWQLDNSGQTYNKIEFRSDEITRYYTIDNEIRSDKIEKSQCKIFSYKEIYLNDLRSIKKKSYKEINKYFIKEGVAIDKKYPSLLLSDDCSDGDIYIAIDNQKGVYILDEENGFMIVNMHRGP
jgi:hypothetical protein